MGVCVHGMATQVNIIEKEYVNFTLLRETLKGSPIFEPCLILETILNDKNSCYIRKLEALIALIESLLTDYLSRKSAEETLLLFRFIYSRTWKVILLDDQGKCNAATYHLKFLFKRLEWQVIQKKLHQLIPSIEYLIKMIDDPWGGQALCNIFNGKMYTNEEVLRLIEAEIKLVLIMRLEILLKAHCLTKALRLTTACLSSINQQYLTRDEHWQFITYIKQIHIILLIKTKNTNEILNEVNKMSLGECLDLVEVPTLYFEKSHKMMADLIANAALAAAVIRPHTEEENLKKLISHWFQLHPSCEGLLEPLRRIVIIAVSSHYIYYFCQIFIQQFGKLEKSFCIELFIRALTLNLNEVERYRFIDDREKITNSEIQLSNGYLMLADYLKDDVSICRECLLTAFSVNPTFSCYEKLKALATTGFNSVLVYKKNQPTTKSITNPKQKKDPYNEDDKNIVNEVIELEKNVQPLNLSKESLLKPTDNCVSQETDSFLDCSEMLIQSVESEKIQICELYDKVGTLLSPQQQEMQISLEKEEGASKNETKLVDSFKGFFVQPYDAQRIGISQRLCDDLSTVINSARYQVLIWDLGWSELSARCMSYIKLGKENRVGKKELKHLNIDYNQFKDRPKNQIYNLGIEKGFESFLQNSTPNSNLKSFIPVKRKKTKQKISNKVKIIDLESTLVESRISDECKVNDTSSLSKVKVPKQFRCGERKSPRISHLNVNHQENVSLTNGLHLSGIYNNNPNNTVKRKRDSFSNKSSQSMKYK